MSNNSPWNAMTVSSEGEDDVEYDLDESTVLGLCFRGSGVASITLHPENGQARMWMLHEAKITRLEPDRIYIEGLLPEPDWGPIEHVFRARRTTVRLRSI